MAADDVLYQASIPAGTVVPSNDVPMNAVIGSNAIRSGYSKGKKPIWIGVQAYYVCSTAQSPVVTINIKNSNQNEGVSLIAADFRSPTALDESTTGYMYGLNCPFEENSTFTVTYSVTGFNSTGASLDIFVIPTFDYSSVSAVSSNVVGYPITKRLRQSATFNVPAKTTISIGTYDNLLPGNRYRLREMIIPTALSTGAAFVILDSCFAEQEGLRRIIPVKTGDIGGNAKQIYGSVEFTKQAYDVKIYSTYALSNVTIPVNIDMWTDKN